MTNRKRCTCILGLIRENYIYIATMASGVVSFVTCEMEIDFARRAPGYSRASWKSFNRFLHHVACKK